MWRKDFLLHRKIWKLCEFLFIFLTGFTSFNIFLLFPLSISLSLYAWFLVLQHLTWTRFSKLTHLLMCLGTLTPIIRDWLTNYGESGRPDELCYNFLSQMTLLSLLTFLLRSLTVILIVMLSLVYLFLLVLVFVLQWFSIHWKILIMWLSQLRLTFFLTVLWLSHGQLWAILKGTASLTLW